MRFFLINNRLHCSNDAIRMLETFYGLYYQAVNKSIPQKTIRCSKAPQWMSSHSIKTENCLQTALKHNYSDEKIKCCTKELKSSLELDKAVYFESRKDCDLKMTYKYLRLINGTANVPRKMSFKNTSLCSNFTICEAFNEFFCISVQNTQQTSECSKRYFFPGIYLSVLRNS